MRRRSRPHTKPGSFLFAKKYRGKRERERRRQSERKRNVERGGGREDRSWKRAPRRRRRRRRRLYRLNALGENVKAERVCCSTRGRPFFFPRSAAARKENRKVTSIRGNVLRRLLLLLRSATIYIYPRSRRKSCGSCVCTLRVRALLDPEWAAAARLHIYTCLFAISIASSQPRFPRADLEGGSERERDVAQRRLPVFRALFAPPRIYRLRDV